MKKLFTFLFFFLALIGFRYSASAQSAEGINVTIDTVDIGVMKDDFDPSEFSLRIKLTNLSADISNWHFGFYMAGTPFDKLIKGSQNINPRIVRQICDSQNHCSELKYDKAEFITSLDWSQGYTIIHSPEKNFVLLSGETYTIEFLHINQWGGWNVSYFPQNFFLLISDSPDNSQKQFNVHLLDTGFGTYTVTGYDYSRIESEISKHIKNNWNTSKEKDEKNISIEVIPSPVKLEMKKGDYKFSENALTIINQFDQDSKSVNHIVKHFKDDIFIKLADKWSKLSFPYVLIEKLKKPEIIKNIPEGYTLDIDESKIVIGVLTDAGIYYALQTLGQLFSQAKRDSNTTLLPQMHIVDYPRFPYRGILLDTARHFFDVKEVKAFIDIMAAHKLNTLHLHLSDDEGFRIDIPFYPSIKAVGNKRSFGLSMGPMMFPQGNLYSTYKTDFYVRANTDYQGTYSIEDISEITRYANVNQITVIPEIDLPAHARALIKALPSVFVDPNDTSEYLSAQGYWDDVLPVCTYNTDISVGPQFTKTINRIANYIANLFNGQTTVYAINNELSIAGDEVSPNAWTKSTSCQGDWLGLTSLQKSHKFFGEMAQRNPQLIFSGWQQFVQTDSIEMGQETVPAKKVGHVWVWNSSEPGIPQAIKLIESGFPTVLAFSDKTYFDLVYTPDIKELGFAWASSWSDTHAALSSIEPTNRIEEKLQSLQSSQNLLGLEGALWSEHLASYDQLLYMALPKMAGLAEASWSPRNTTAQGKKINWKSLAQRLGRGNRGFLAYLNRVYGAQYRGYPHGIHLEVPIDAWE